MSETIVAPCVLLADISGSAKLIEKLGSAEAQHAIERCLRRMERAAEAFKGRVAETADDRLTVVFDSVEAAMHGAAEMQQRIDALPPVSGVALAIRVGCHVGPVSEQDGHLSGDTVDVAAGVLALAKGRQTLITAEAVAVLPKALRSQTRTMDGLTIPGRDGIGVSEAVWSHAEIASAAASQTSGQNGLPGAAETRLKLRLGDQELMLGPDRPTATLGRDAHADIMTMDTRASRNHGRIEYRRGKYVLVDQSTNGSYVTFAGEQELVLKREEAILSGRGHICFGHASGDATERLEFEVVG